MKTTCKNLVALTEFNQIAVLDKEPPAMNLKTSPRKQVPKYAGTNLLEYRKPCRSRHARQPDLEEEKAWAVENGNENGVLYTIVLCSCT